MSKRIMVLLVVSVGVFLIGSVELVHAQDQDEVDEATSFVKEVGLTQFCRAIFNANEFVFVH